LITRSIKLVCSLETKRQGLEQAGTPTASAKFINHRNTAFDNTLNMK